MSPRKPLAVLGALAVVAALAVGAPASGAATGPAAGTTGGAAAGTSGDRTAGAPGGISVVGDTSPIHDPALTVDDEGTWWVYSTGLLNRENGGTVQMWSSHDDGTTWAYEGTVWDEIPAWIDEHFSDGALPDNLWAPEIHEHDGTYYLYYSASRFGTDNSLTALATNTTLDPDDPDYEWVDQGPVITSPSPIEDGKTFNAIDAGIVTGDDGTPYMAIGSHWYGIFLVEISWPSGKLVDGALENAVHLVDRFAPGNRVEAPYIYERGGWYYLFVSFDACCAGADSTYKVAVGRSRSVTGPYLDKQGRNMVGGGGTVLLESNGPVAGPGGQSVHDGVLAYHYYDGANEEIPYFPTLGLHRMAWEDGWPVVDQTLAVPSISAEPADVEVASGGRAVFRTEAVGTPRPAITWEVSDDGGATWRAPSGGQPGTRGDGTSVLALRGVTPDLDGLQVRATAQNAAGRTTTDEATLTVN